MDNFSNPDLSIIDVPLQYTQQALKLTKSRTLNKKKETPPTFNNPKKKRGSQ